MLKDLAFSLTFISSMAHAADLLCSPSPVDVDFKVPTVVSKKGVQYGGESYGFVYLKERQGRFNPRYSFTELRVSADRLEWSIQCVNQAQLANLRELGLLK